MPTEREIMRRVFRYRDPHVQKSDDPKWDELERINQANYHQRHIRELNEYFVANSRVFSAAELEVIANYKKAEAAYWELFGKKG